MHGKNCLIFGNTFGSLLFNIYYLNNLVTGETRPDQTVYCFNANEFEPEALAGQSIHCDVCIRLEMLMLC